MRKKALLAMLLVMSLVLSGCALIQKDPKVDAAQEILRLGDQVYTKAQVQERVQSELESAALYNQLYYGTKLDITDASIISQAQTYVVETLEQEMALEAKTKELGLDQLTEEEEQKAQEDAQSHYDSELSYVKNYELTDSGLEGEELDKAAAEHMAEDGYTMEKFLEDAKKEIISEKLEQYAIKDVTVTDEEVQAEYDSKVAADKETYGENANSYVSAANNGSTLYYAPAGVRRVKQILTSFKDEDKDAISAANTAISEANTNITAANNKISADQEVVDSETATEEEKATAQADLDAAKADLEAAQNALTEAQKALSDATETAFANIDADTDAILEELANGGDWDTLMAEKNSDPGMKSGETAEKGYAVCAGMTSFDSAFVEAAMALEKIGDYSGKIRGTSYGYYIIKYVGDEPEGAISFDSVKEDIHDDLLETKQDETYDAAVEEWVKAANVKIDMNALKD